jgi:transcriptional regulator with XRE-family HTH domain
VPTEGCPGKPGTPRSTPLPDLPLDRRFAGSRLRHARLLLGLNQAEAAERVPTSQGRWSEYETGVHEPSAATLPAVCAAVEIPIDYVFAPVELEVAE